MGAKPEGRQCGCHRGRHSYGPRRPGRPHFSSPERVCFGVRSAVPDAIQGFRSPTLPSEHRAESPRVRVRAEPDIYTLRVMTGLCTPGPLRLGRLGRSLRDSRLQGHESSRETHIGQVFKLQREDSDYLGGVSHRAAPSEAARRPEAPSAAPELVVALSLRTTQSESGLPSALQAFWPPC